jgi:hypothetical protein
LRVAVFFLQFFWFFLCVRFHLLCPVVCLLYYVRCIHLVVVSTFSLRFNISFLLVSHISSDLHRTDFFFPATVSGVFSFHRYKCKGLKLLVATSSACGLKLLVACGLKLLVHAALSY